MTRKPQPSADQRMAEKVPAFIAAIDHMGSLIRQAGPLDEKSIQLIQLAAAAAIRSEGALHGHSRRALNAGASPAEIRHALLCLTGIIGFPGVAAALAWADDELETDSSSRR